MRILIIGATSAVAQQVIQQLSDQAASIFCIARDDQAMQQLAARYPQSIKGYYCCDFTQDGAELSIVEALEVLGGFDRVLFAHGFLPDQLQTETDMALVEATFATNCLSVIRLLIPVLTQLKGQGSGKLGVITSVAGDRGRPRNFTYGAAKGALVIYLQGLRSTLYASGVEVYTFKLGPVDTPMTIDHEKNFSFTTPEVAARYIVRAFDGRRYEVYVPGFWRWVMWAVRNMPEWLFQRLGFLSAR